MDNMKRIQLLQCHESDVNSCDFGNRDRLATASRYEVFFLYNQILYLFNISCYTFEANPSNFLARVILIIYRKLPCLLKQLLFLEMLLLR